MAQMISTLSAEYARVHVEVKKQGQPYDASADTVKMAFVVEGTNPGGGDWNVAAWESDLSSGSLAFWAVCLVGAGGVVLPAGTYVKWVWITDSPEAPIWPGGQLTVY